MKPTGLSWRTRAPWPTPSDDWRVRRLTVRADVTTFIVIGGFCGCIGWLALLVFGAFTKPLFPRLPWAAWRYDAAAAVLGVPGVRCKVDPSRPGERRGAMDRTLGPAAAVPFMFVAFGVQALVLAARDAASASVAVGGGIALACILVVVRVAWQGGVEVQWDPATLHPGATAVFHVGTTPGGARLVDARFLLRCVGPWVADERHRERGPRVRWESEVSADACEAPGPDDFVRVTFDIPPGVPPSDLGGYPPTWWELIVRGRTLWGTVTESFLVPVRDVGGRPTPSRNVEPWRRAVRDRPGDGLAAPA